jgi:hypothetical protein
MNEYGENQLTEDTQKRVVDKYKRSFYEMFGKNGGPSEKGHAQDKVSHIRGWR